MAKKTVRDAEVGGKRVLVRVDFNVPLKDGRVTDDSRIRAAVPTIEYLCERQCRVVLMSHLGRPKGGPDDALRLDPVAMRLGQLLAAPVRKVNELTGAGVEATVAAMKPGDVVLLENSRFDPREEKNDPELVLELARLGDLFVNDAFSAAHRAHATTSGLASKLPTLAGFSMEAELNALDALLTASAKPFVVVLGGAKVTDKIKVIDRFLDLADSVLIGGAMSFAFLKAQGLSVGASKVEEAGVAVAAERTAEGHGYEMPAAAAHRRGRGGRIRRVRRDRHRAGGRYPRRLDGTRYRPGDGEDVCNRDRGRGPGVLERPDGCF